MLTILIINATVIPTTIKYELIFIVNFKCVIHHVEHAPALDLKSVQLAAQQIIILHLQTIPVWIAL